MPRLSALLAAILALIACSNSTPAGSGPSGTPGGPAANAPTSSPAQAIPVHVFVVVMENTAYSGALAQPTIARLAATYGLATDYHAVAHPSLPNYLAMTSGETFGITDDDYHQLPLTGIGVQLDQKHVPWRAYFEGLTGDCFTSPAPYALKHDAYAYFGGSCPSQVVDISKLGADLALPADQAPRLSWITPGLCHDGHDCDLSVAAQYLDGLVGQITASPAWKAGGVLFITWDEDDGSASNHVPLLVVSPDDHGATSARAYDHYSLLATIEDLLGVPRLGQAQAASPINDLVRMRAR